jgi:TPR repeat protein
MNDPVAIREMGKSIRKGGDKSAFEYFSKAAELGDVEAHFELSWFYRDGKGGVNKDNDKMRYHLEEAAIRGHPEARHNLGVIEWDSGMKAKAVKHWIIAATLGNDISPKALKEGFKAGLISKKDYAAALRAYQAAMDAMTSPLREEAKRCPEEKKKWK